MIVNHLTREKSGTYLKSCVSPPLVSRRYYPVWIFTNRQYRRSSRTIRPTEKRRLSLTTWFVRADSSLRDDVDRKAQPYDHSNIQLNARVLTDRFRKIERPDGLTELHIDDISKELPEFPSTAVRVCWFGQLPEEILVQKFEEDGKVATTFAGVEEPRTFQVLLE